jgi:hypothetical protein
MATDVSSIATARPPRMVVQEVECISDLDTWFCCRGLSGKTVCRSIMLVVVVGTGTESHIQPFVSLETIFDTEWDLESRIRERLG